DFRTYAELDSRARAAAAKWAAVGVNAGDRLLICLPTSWDLLELYFGAICRGALPVLVAPPGALGGAEAHAKKVDGLLKLITQRNVIHNTEAIAHMSGSASGEPHTVVSWLPLNHDMGLVGCLLFALVKKFNFWLLRPESFLARPRLWLQTISRHKGTLSPAPN